ncbi:MAG: HNH endonuclease signature motif containing protein, partial [Desulfuromonadales bacterium]
MPINERVKRLLWSRSGGYCQNPGCQSDFFTFFENGEISSIEELAHMVARSSDGPRGQGAIPIGQRDEYENIILLCPSCHSLVDKNPTQFPEALLLQWKAVHEQKIKDVFVAPVFTSRGSLAARIHELLRENSR